MSAPTNTEPTLRLVTAGRQARFRHLARLYDGANPGPPTTLCGRPVNRGVTPLVNPDLPVEVQTDCRSCLKKTDLLRWTQSSGSEWVANAPFGTAHITHGDDGYSAHIVRYNPDAVTNLGTHYPSLAAAQVAVEGAR